MSNTDSGSEQPAARSPEPSPKLFLANDFWICLAIVIITIATYANVRNFAYINFDDSKYPLNIHLSGGLTWESVKWAFTTGELGNWHPLTWLSLLIDHQLFGFQSGPAHVTNLILHVLAVLMLYFFLRRATGAIWPSALVAFVFAIHPLNVESVAWVSERKNILCAFFWFFTCWAWVWYSERPTVRRYLLVLVSFGLGLLSKPMIVTLPGVLLLLDVWPLRRRLSSKLLIEKIPLLAVAAISSAITFAIQQHAGYVSRLETLPLATRVENALITVAIYIGKAICPVDLPFWYPYPKSIPLWQPLVAALAILAVSIFVIRRLRPSPFLAVGWFWYLGTLIPVLGLVQVGQQSRADRYMYEPIVGLSIMLAWGALDAASRWPRTRAWIASALACACLALIPDAWIQIQYWENTEKLFSHALQVSEGNKIAYHGLGAILMETGRQQQALVLFDEQLRNDPQAAVAHSDRGSALRALGRLDEAANEFKTAIAIDPHHLEAYVEYGALLEDQGKWQEAISEQNLALTAEGYRDAASDNWKLALYYRGVAYAGLGRFNEAIDSYTRALAIAPDDLAALVGRGKALYNQGRWGASVLDFSEAVHSNPNYADAWLLRGEAMAKLGRMYEAVDSFQNAARLDPKDASSRNMLGYALMRIPGRAPEALEPLREAIRLDPNLVGARENLARLLARNPATLPEAIAQIEAAIRIQPSPAEQQYLEKLKATR